MDKRLPGDLTVWRGRWLRWRRGSRRPSPAVLLDPQRHAELADLVRDAAKLAETDVPPTVGLGGDATVVARGPVLIVGLPLVLGLSPDDLRTVVAHELALPATRHRGLVHDLLALPRTPELDAVAEGVEKARDAAAIDAIGGGLAAVEDAASALLRAEAVRLHFTAFPRGFTGLRLLDLHSFWQVYLDGHPGPLPLPDPAFAHAHPGLTGELLDLIEGGELVHASPVTVHVDLPDDDESLRKLAVADVARQPAETDATAGAGDWVRGADLPVEVYLGDVEARARQVVEAVQVLLDGPPEDRSELAGVLIHRAAAVNRADPALDQPDGARLLADVVEYTLLKRGWRRTHALLPRRLAHGAERVDLDALDPTELRARLF